MRDLTLIRSETLGRLTETLLALLAGAVMGWLA
jgi:hypothetical protein